MDKKEIVDLSVIIVSFNTKKLLIACLKSIESKTKGIKSEVIVVDNGSKDGLVEELKRQQKNNQLVIFNKKNVGFAAANNQGIRKARGRYILLLNSDTAVSSDIFKEMVFWMDQNQKAGIATCMLKNQDGSIQGTGGYFPTLPRVFSWMTIQDLPFVDKFIKPFHPMRSRSFDKGTVFYETKKELDWVTGAFFLVRRQVVDEIGLLDEDYFMYVEELDYCYRAKERGWKIWYLPEWQTTHFGGASSTSEFALLSEYKGVKLFYKKHYPTWQYSILRLLLKIGALGRMVLFGILEGPSAAKIYAKAFSIA